MHEVDYSNREIDTKFFNLKEHIDENHQVVMETLDRIEKQTTKTNGRVSSLENWRSWIVGGLAVFAFLVIPLLVYAFNLAIK